MKKTLIIAAALAALGAAVPAAAQGIEITPNGSQSSTLGPAENFTGHVVVDPGWFTKLAEPTEDEEDMLDLAFDLQETSRLGCQIIMTEALDGLVVKLPAGSRNAGG